MFPQLLAVSAGEAAWPPDWSQFVPDAILSIVGGVIIGVFLWRLQTTAEANQARRAAEDGWSIARSQVGSAVLTPFKRENLMGDFARLANQVKALKKLMETKPFSAWSDAAPKDIELQLMRELTRHYYYLEGLLIAMERDLQDYYREAFRGTNSTPTRFIAYSRSHVLGVAAPHMPFGVKAQEALDKHHVSMAKELGQNGRFIVIRDSLDLFEKHYNETRDRLMPR